MLLLTLAALIPPPPGWTPPQASGPGTFCGRTFRLALRVGETVRADWPGEMFINDVYSTYRVRTSRGEVVIAENGDRTRLTGRSRPLRASGTTFRSHGGGAYQLAVRGNPSIRAVTIRFNAGEPEGVARELLSRISPGVPAGTTCLQPENR